MEQTGNREQQEVRLLSQALQYLAAGQLVSARSALLSIVQRAPQPGEYRYLEEVNDEVRIRFWDKEEFLHYVGWAQAKGLHPNRRIIWLPGIYPRAWYFLAYVALELKDYRDALECLTCGEGLEPTNPRFALERAQVHMVRCEYDAALQIYRTLTEAGPHVSPLQVAQALRGRGFVEIERGQLHEAEDTFRRSLELDPKSELAQNELAYIRRLRKGGAAKEPTLMRTVGSDGKSAPAEEADGALEKQDNEPKT